MGDKVVVKDLGGGRGITKDIKDLPENVQKGIEGAIKAGCHAFTWQTKDGSMKTIVVEKEGSGEGRRK